MYKCKIASLLAVSLIVAVAVMAGCNSSSNVPPPVTSTIPIISKISGTVTCRQQVNLSPEARLDLQLVNVSQSSYIVEQMLINPIGQIPINFEMKFDPKAINQKDIYVVKATIIDGERRYVPSLQYPVLTKGAPSQIEIIVNPETTASEKLKSEFGKLENLIGGMKRVTGEKESEEANVGWDAFFDGDNLRLIREITDRGEKGRTSVKYAYYKTGQPMFGVKEDQAAGSNHPATIVRVGWNETGETVVKEKIGAQDAAVSSDEIKKLYDAAKVAQTTANLKKKK